MNDMSATIAAKSDQLNSDDLIGGPITIEITDARVMMAEQPCIINYKGDNGKPWKPGKSMRRVLVAAWGTDPKAYVGRALTLYRDPEVSFGGVKVGGIRISHMSHINSPLVTSLTVTRGNKKPFKVLPLVIDAPKAPVATVTMSDGREIALNGLETLKTWWKSIGPANQITIGGAEALAELKMIAQTADAADINETPFEV